MPPIRSFIYLLIPTLLVLLTLAGCAELSKQWENLDTTPDTTPSDGLREALRVGTVRAVDSVGRPDGFLGNPEIEIQVPEELLKVVQALRLIGAGRLVDEFTISMNRAAAVEALPGRRLSVVDPTSCFRRSRGTTGGLLGAGASLHRYRTLRVWVNGSQSKNATNPSYAQLPSVVWTGSEMILWGGQNHGDGAAYDPTIDQWRALSDAGAGLGVRQVGSSVPGSSVPGRVYIVTEPCEFG